MQRLALLAATFLLFGCSGSSNTPNATPSSSGGSPGPGASQNQSPHPHDFGLTDEYRYEKNGEVKLPREYWIIIVAKDGTRAMLPRPDGDARIVEECTKETALAKLFRDAQLCTSASSQQAVARVNALSASEATQISTFLHSKLRFVVKNEPNVRVDPYALRSDLLDICKKFPERASILQRICDDLFRYEAAGGGAEIAVTYSADEARVIATRLNELYGIPIE